MRKDVLKPAVNADNTQFTKPISKGLQPPRPRVEEDKVLVWRERFKTFRFWILDTSVDKGGDALLKDVKRMQADYVFTSSLYSELTKNRLDKSKCTAITHVISFDLVVQRYNEGRQLRKSRGFVQETSPSYGTLQVSLFYLELSKVLNAILPKGKRNLEESLRRDRIFGPSTHGEMLQFKPFVGNYILVEEMSGKYRPIVAREYTDNDWPRIHWNPSKRCVFAPNSGSLEYSSSSNPSEPLIVQPLQNSAASGVISCSTAPFQVQNRGNSEYLAKLSNRIAAPTPTPVKDAPENNNEPKGKKKSIGLGFYKRAGYCENCGVKYNEYMQHVKSSKHRKWALNESNFATIDTLITRIEKNNAIINETSLLERQIKMMRSLGKYEDTGGCAECESEYNESVKAPPVAEPVVSELNVSKLAENNDAHSMLTKLIANDSTVLSSALNIVTDSTDLCNDIFAKPRQPLTELQYNLESEDVSAAALCFKKRKLEDVGLTDGKRPRGSAKSKLATSLAPLNLKTLGYGKYDKLIKSDAIDVLRHIELSDSLSDIESFIESDLFSGLEDNKQDIVELSDTERGLKKKSVKLKQNQQKK